MGSGTSGCLRLLDEAVLLEHAEPPRRVALDGEPLVVDAGVGVGPVVAQDGVNHAQELVGGGENGAFVAEAAGLRAVIAVELGALGADGAVGAFGQGGPQGQVASARPPGAALAGAGVVAGGDAGPGARGGAPRGRPPGRVRVRRRKMVAALPKSMPGIVCSSRRGRSWSASSARMLVSRAARAVSVRSMSAICIFNRSSEGGG